MSAGLCYSHIFPVSLLAWLSNRLSVCWGSALLSCFLHRLRGQQPCSWGSLRTQGQDFANDACVPVWHLSVFLSLCTSLTQSNIKHQKFGGPVRSLPSVQLFKLADVQPFVNRRRRGIVQGEGGGAAGPYPWPLSGNGPNGLWRFLRCLLLGLILHSSRWDRLVVNERVIKVKLEYGDMSDMRNN